METNIILKTWEIAKFLADKSVNLPQRINYK